MSDDGLVGQFLDEIDPIVFGFGALVTVSVIVAFFINPAAVQGGIQWLYNTLVGTFDWAILLIVFVIVVFLLFLIVGPWGSIRLGDESPEYSFFAFFAMLYSAGFAAGVVFWGPTEALFYYNNPSPVFDVAGSSAAAIPVAIAQTLFHWALPQLATFTIMGIAIGYFAYNYDSVPLRVSSALTPLIGKDNLDGWTAKVVDILAVFATIGGVATSLGFIGSQFVKGLDYQWGISMGNMGILLVVTMMTLLFTTSMVLGVDKGIRRLSNFNMVLFVVLMLATLILGPTAFLLLLGPHAMAIMINNFISMSLFTGAGQFAAGQAAAIEWMDAWTVFYWAWALSWSPFAGLFIARIAKGRTVREVAFTGIVATSAATIPWFTWVGGTSLWLQHNSVADFSAVMAGKVGAEVSGFILFGALPLGEILMLAFMVLVTTFFVTSADSSTLAVSMMTTGGKARPSTLNRIFWGVLLGMTAAILMILGGSGSANTLQQAVLITGTPFAFVAFLAIVSLVRDFGVSHDQVLLQEETVLYGSGSDSESETEAAVAGSSDD